MKVMTIADKHGIQVKRSESNGCSHEYLCQNQFILLVRPPMPVLRIGCKQSFYLVAMSTTLAQILI